MLWRAGQVLPQRTVRLEGHMCPSSSTPAMADLPAARWRPALITHGHWAPCCPQRGGASSQVPGWGSHGWGRGGAGAGLWAGNCTVGK